MKIISWNVNGLNSILEKGFGNTLEQLNADFVCIQETKISKEIEIINNYYKYFNYSKKNGYSGVGILSKEKPINILIGMKIENEEGMLEDVDDESRVITLEYNNFFITSVYVPTTNGRGRYNYRQDFDNNFLQFINDLNSKKDVIICGDFNICHSELDVCDVQNHFSLDNFNNDEKANFEELLNLGFIDTFRYKNNQIKKYSFWKYGTNRNKELSGWRLDYILVSDYLKEQIIESNILNEIEGSDHCPTELVIKL